MRPLLGTGLVLALTALAGCGGSSSGGGGSSTGFLTQSLDAAGSFFGHDPQMARNLRMAESASRVADKAAQLQPLGPREEHYLGRAVTANVIQRYGVHDDPDATRYVNLVGQSIALASDEPSTWGGYRFIILDTGEVNAIAAPGGFVMVTRGMLERCRSEDAVAAVLAHEIVHVQEQHGIELVEKARGQEFMLTLGSEIAKNVGDRNVAQLSGMLTQFVDEFLLTLLDRGYDRDLEYEADALAVGLLADAGYDPHGLHDVLDELRRRSTPGQGWFSTHPDPQDRLSRIEPDLHAPRTVPNDVRERRFRAALASVRQP